MRINIISPNRNQTGLAQDADLVQGLFASVLESNGKFRRVFHNQPECEEAEVNVFLEVVTPSLMTYAAKNIWIPNPEWTYQTWKPYVDMFDEIWCKTREAERIFSSLATRARVRYIGWSSIDKGCPDKKNFSKALVLVGKNIYRHPQIIVDALTAHTDTLPELHIVYNGDVMKLDCDNPKIKTYPATLKTSEYDALLQECGIAICVSGAEGFGHAVNEAASAGCCLVLSDIAPFREFGFLAEFIPSKTTVPHPQCLGVVNTWADEDIHTALRKVSELKFKAKRELSEKTVEAYAARHQAWLASAQDIIREFTADIPEFKLEMPKEEDLPAVSIITPTRDRLRFMEFARGCIEGQTYPQSKIEWVVIDDGKVSCKPVLDGMPNVKYICESEGKTIAWKRNRGIAVSSNPIILHMDDDDIYPANSVLYRVAMLLLEPKKECAFCTTIPCYDIKNYISFVNVPPVRLPMSMRVSEATLTHTRAFWESGKFEDGTHIAEGNSFIRGREHKCREISPQEVIVSLVHPRTTSSRKAPAGMEPNGCHYGFSEELFKELSELAQSLEQV